MIENVSTYVREWDEVQVFPFTTACLTRLHEAGYLLFVITNQAIVGKGLLSLETIQHLHNRIIEAVDPSSFIAESYVCPHTDAENCDCRKPKPGSFFRAAEKYNLDLDRSFMIGDGASDAEAGLNAGVKPVLVRTGRGHAQEPHVDRERVTVVDSLVEATDLILGSH